jgi:spore maturation protein CgeB
MRVGVIGPVGLDRVAGNVGDALQRMGHLPILLGPARPRHRHRMMTRATMLARQALPRLDEAIQNQIARRALDAGCEVVVNIDLDLMPNVVARLRSDGARVAFWFPDHVANLARQLMLLAPYDALFFKEPHLVERLRATLDLPVYYLPEACNPRWHRPLVPAGTEPYLVVAGNMYPYRVRLLERLIARGIPLRLYGADFPRWLGETPIRSAHSGCMVFHEDKSRVFRSAAGVLNTMFPAEIAGANGRLFQAAGSGGAVLTEFRPVVPELFAVGDEVLVYHDFDELVDNATRLLSEAGLTARLGDAAASRAHRDHTYDIRLTTILEKVS